MTRQNTTMLTKRNTLLVVFTALVLIVLVGAFTYHKLYSGESASKHFYVSRLNALAENLNALPKTFELSGKTDNDLEKYDALLGSMAGSCNKIESKRQDLSKQTVSKKLQDSTGKASKLCHDLTPIIEYSRKLYGISGAYLSFTANPWPSASTTEFAGRLSQTQYVIQQTMDGYKKLSYPDVNDPALSELLSQVESAQNLANHAQEALKQNDIQAAQTIAEKLQHDLMQDKNDFLNARSYFWNNTVQLAALKDTVKKLQSEF